MRKITSTTLLLGKTMQETLSITNERNSATWYLRYLKAKIKLSQAWDLAVLGINGLRLTGHSETLSLSEYSAFRSELWEREFMQLHHIDLWETEERWGGEGNWAAWRRSKIRSPKKHKSIGLHHKTWWIWDNCVGMNVVREALAIRWGQTYLK